MPDRSPEVYDLRRVGAVFAGASLALLAVLVWWLAIDRDQAWHAWQRRQADLLEAIAHTDFLAVESDKFAREFADAEAALAEADSPQAERHARRRLDALERFRQDTRERAEGLAAWTQSRWRHWPVLGRFFKAPPSRDLAVRQVELEHVWYDLHFTRAGRTDRCTTCHTAIADARFTKRSLARRIERTLRLVNSDREAKGQAPVPLPGMPGRDDVEPGYVTDHWASLTDRQRDALFEQLAEKMNSYQAMRGRPSLHLAAPLLAHPDLDLFADENAVHPIGRMGCTICHEGQGQATDFWLAGHTAGSPAQRRRWERIHTTTVGGGVPVHTPESAAARWDRPMWPLGEVQASCTVCHTDVADLAVHAGRKVNNRIDRGRMLFTSMGCANCHLVDEVADAPRIGPDLMHVPEKLSRAYLQRWILDPHHHRPATRMPDFFGQENNDPISVHADSDPDLVLRGRAEAVAMAEYLRWVGEPSRLQAPPADLWAMIEDATSHEALAAAERGRRLTGAVGCLGCHAALGHRPDDEAGRPLDPLGVDWIGHDLAERMEADFRAQHPDRRLTDDELDDIEDAAFMRAEQMSYAEQVRYALRHLATDETTLFAPEDVGDFLFTTRAPELTGLAARFEDDGQALLWMYDFLRDPRQSNPNARMPRMQLERRTAADDPDVVVSDEALDIAAYLVGLPATGVEPPLPLDEEPAVRRQLETARDALIARRLARIGIDVAVASPSEQDEALKAALVSRLSGPVGQHDAQARVERLDRPQRAWVFLGEQMIGHYGCFGCHGVPGFERAERIGPDHNDWGRVPMDRLDCGLLDPRYPGRADGRALPDTLYPPDRAVLIERIHGNPLLEIEPTRSSFAWHKVRNPRLWDRGRDKALHDEMRMPNAYLDDEQAASLVTYLLSRRPVEVDPLLQVDGPPAPAGRVAVGRSLARHHNCVACHRIDGNEAVHDQFHWVWRAMQRLFDEERATPPLGGTGAMLRPDWLIAYLADVETIRPQLDVRMPQYALTHEEAEQLVGYLVGVDQLESRRLSELVGRWHAEAEPTELPAWLTGSVPDETAEDALQRYAVNNRLTTAAVVEAARPDPQAAARLNARLAREAAFLADLLDVRYPYAEPSPPPPSPERLADGRTLFVALDCLSCHVFGDPAAPGAHPRPTGPNLARTHDRLRYAWVRHWLARTDIIRPGTRMPAHFGEGDRSALAMFSAERHEEIRNALNDPDLADDAAAQIRAITDFLFDASRRSLDIVVPPPPAETDSEAIDSVPDTVPAETAPADLAPVPDTAPADVAPVPDTADVEPVP